MLNRLQLFALAGVLSLLCACHSTHKDHDNSKVDNSAANEESTPPDNNEPANTEPANEVSDPDNEEFCLLPPEARPQDLNDKIEVGQVAPDFKLNDPKTGEEVKLSFYRGKTVLLFFWASWCPYCKMAYKPKGSMNKLSQEVVDANDPGLVLINIGTSIDDTAETQEAFFKSNEVKAISTHDEGNKLESTYGILGVPTCVVIGKDGKILTFGSYRVGKYSQQLLEYVRQECIEKPEGE